MHKMNEEHAAKARKAIAACGFDPHQDLKDSVKDILVDIGHLCDAENIDFVTALKRAINSWAVERIDPTSVADGPTVEVVIGSGRPAARAEAGPTAEQAPPVPVCLASLAITLAASARGRMTKWCKRKSKSARTTPLRTAI